MAPAPCTCPLLLTSHAKQRSTLSSCPSAWGSGPGRPHRVPSRCLGKALLCWALRVLLLAAGLSTPGPGDLAHTAVVGVCPVLLTRQARVGSWDPNFVWRQQGVCRSPGAQPAWGSALRAALLAQVVHGACAPLGAARGTSTVKSCEAQGAPQPPWALQF